MKLLLTLLFLAGSFIAPAQTKIDGAWKGTHETQNGAFELNYTFKTEENKLKGQLKMEFGEAPLENGTMDGKKFTFTITLNDLTVNNSGEMISDDEILIKNEFGEVKLTRVKSS